MDLGGEAVLTLRGCGPLPTCHDTKAGVMHVNEDPRLPRARAIPATEISRKAAAVVQGIFPDFGKKMSQAGSDLECGSLLPHSKEKMLK